MSEFLRRVRARRVSPSVVGGVPVEPVCSACRATGRLWQRDGTRTLLCAKCIDALLWMAGDMNEMARRKVRSA